MRFVLRVEVAECVSAPRLRDTGAAGGVRATPGFDLTPGDCVAAPPGRDDLPARGQGCRWRRAGRAASVWESGHKVGSSGAARGRAGLARERADPHEREVRAVRTAQVPGERCRRRGRHDDRFLQQRLDLPQSGPRRGMQPAEVSHAMLSRWRHVLQIPPQELRGAEGALPAGLRPGVGVGEAHFRATRDL